MPVIKVTVQGAIKLEVPRKIFRTTMSSLTWTSITRTGTWTSTRTKISNLNIKIKRNSTLFHSRRGVWMSIRAQASNMTWLECKLSDLAHKTNKNLRKESVTVNSSSSSNRRRQCTPNSLIRWWLATSWVQKWGTTTCSTLEQCTQKCLRVFKLPKGNSHISARLPVVSPFSKN